MADVKEVKEELDGADIAGLHALVDHLRFRAMADANEDRAAKMEQIVLSLKKALRILGAEWIPYEDL